MELIGLLPHMARGLGLDWDKGSRYAGMALPETG
jgi:hypothetical protein